MPRQPTLRKHSGYWFSQAGGGSGTYFGKVGEVTHSDVKEEFAKQLDSLRRFAGLIPAPRSGLRCP